VVVDTSAIVSVLLKEADARPLIRKLYRAHSRQISAVSYMESSMVLMSRLGDNTEGALDGMLQRAKIAIVPVSVDHAKVAVAAFRQYGKGRHPASLNFGTASATPWPKVRANHCCSKVSTSPRRMSHQPEVDDSLLHP
jgi:ribonuclease VapC